ncbi:MAG: AbrB/MazE/SpoVT family DNA-binding domain-containing protein, partial [Actinomycetota bacterium]|nr:AbrB/MazE/SpoVT family DNA-binding domain-containing protein [Actinomycetota bacterium]
MAGTSSSRVRLRPKRQLTLPPEICAGLSIEPGDMLELSLEGSALVARPKKVAALEALRELEFFHGDLGVSLL